MTGLVHQIAISDEDEVQLTGYLREAVESVRCAFPTHEHRIWTHGDARRFIRAHFGLTVAWAFDVFRPYAFKADLLKYCLMHEFGGWYIDLGVTMVQSPESLLTGSPDPDFVLFRETGDISAPWNISLACMYATPGSRVFRRAIREVVRNCVRHEYGAHTISPTLPALGRALAIEDIQERHVTGVAIRVHGQLYERAYELHPHGQVARRKPKNVSAGSIDGLGLTGTNNYVRMWREGQVFENIVPPGPWLVPSWAVGVVRQQYRVLRRRAALLRARAHRWSNG